jgi:hypothetical protein
VYDGIDLTHLGHEIEEAVMQREMFKAITERNRRRRAWKKISKEEREVIKSEIAIAWIQSQSDR